jgi:hypothetical protein
LLIAKGDEAIPVAVQLGKGDLRLVRIERVQRLHNATGQKDQQDWQKPFHKLSNLLGWFNVRLGSQWYCCNTKETTAQDVRSVFAARDVLVFTV